MSRRHYPQVVICDENVAPSNFLRRSKTEGEKGWGEGGEQNQNEHIVTNVNPETGASS